MNSRAESFLKILAALGIVLAGYPYCTGPRASTEYSYNHHQLPHLNLGASTQPQPRQEDLDLGSGLRRIWD